ncbi:MAG: hypothetical protein AAB252_02990, partial [Pseudomonadota bacterium]
GWEDLYRKEWTWDSVGFTTHSNGVERLESGAGRPQGRHHGMAVAGIEAVTPKPPRRDNAKNNPEHRGQHAARLDPVSALRRA